MLSRMVRDTGYKTIREIVILPSSLIHASLSYQQCQLEIFISKHLNTFSRALSDTSDVITSKVGL